MNKRKLKSKMVERGYNQKKLSEEMDISLSTLQRKLSASSKLYVEDIYKIKDILKLNSEECSDIFFKD